MCECHSDVTVTDFVAGMLHTQRSNVAKLKTRKRAEVLNGIAQFEENLIENFDEGAKVQCVARTFSEI